MGSTEKKTVTQNAEKYIREVILRDVLGVLTSDDGKSFEEKKKSAVAYLLKCANESPTDAQEKIIGEERHAADINRKFWGTDYVISAGNGITMRQVLESDREGYLEIQKEYLVTKHMLKEPIYCDSLWEEHNSCKRLTLSILFDGKYIGYCGINDITSEPWEIGVELRPEWTGRGIGYCAVSKMVDEIRARLGVRVFCARIDPRNRASQKMFCKLGAVPDGISAAWTNDQNLILKCEEDNLNQIDEELIQLAERFRVPPRKLLSHILKYSLILQQVETEKPRPNR